MTGQELATAFHHSVAPIILVFNNQMYGTIRMHQEKTYPGRVSGTALTNPDFSKFIEAYGGHGEIVEKTEELVPAVKRAIASGKPALVEVRTNPEQITNRATVAQLRAQATGGAAPAEAPPKKAKAKEPAQAARAATSSRSAAPRKR
jgi:acetolactate synthase-1/2/3 large subunit